MDRHEWLYKRIVILFAYIKARLADDPYREPTLALREQQMIRNFTKRLGKVKDLNSVGEDYLIHYFIFQAARWWRIDSHRFGGTYAKPKVIVLSWLVGPKALTHWLERDQTGDFMVRYNTFIRSRHFDRNDIYALFKAIPTDSVELAKKTLNPAEEQDKRQYFNKDIGFAFCVENTSLYNGSKLCMRCRFKVSCKILLKENYPNLYMERGYGER